MNRLRDLFRLLRPHAAPHIVALVLVVVLGTGSALLQKGAYLLLKPTWTALFPSEEVQQEDAAEDAAVDPAVESAARGLGDRIVDGLESAKDSFDGFVLGDPKELVGPESDAARKRALIRVGWLVSLMALLAGLCQYGMGVLAGRVSLEIIVSLRMRLARHLMKLSMRYHAGRRFGDLLSRISSDVGSTSQLVGVVLKDLVQEPIQLAVALSVAFLINWKVALFVVVGLPVFLIPIAMLLKKVRRSSQKSATQLGSTFQVLTQMFQGIRTVKAYRTEERELERFESTNRSFVSASMKMVRASTLSRAWTIFIANFGIAVIVVVFGLWVLNEPDPGTGGDMLTFFLMISQASSHLKRTTRMFTQVSEAQGPAQRLQDLLAETPDVVEAQNPVQLSSIGDGIRFESVGFEYPADGDDAGAGERDSSFGFRDLDLTIHRGETLALVGPSGSGKSTLLDLVARFVDPTSGRVLVGGEDLREVSQDSWTSLYALVTQAPFLFHASVSDNIRYGRPDASDDEVFAAARAANIHEFILGLPQGYETDVRDAGARLSGGQRQRITIARALLRDPELLLLDEATSALDTESEAVVQAALDSMMEGRTTIVIAHRLSTIRGADRIAVVDQGRIAELGTHDELMALGGVYRRLSEAQAL